MSTWIKHYNHNHDPRNGQFTYSGSSVTVAKKQVRHPITNKPIKQPPVNKGKELESKIQEATKNIKLDSKTIRLYKNAGLSQKDAEAAALRKKKIAIIMGVTAGVALTAVAGYMIYKHHTNPLINDLTLRKGLKMQTLSEFADRTSNGDPFFASIAKRDNATYISRFGKTTDKLGNKNKIINTLNKSSKIASVKNSQKVFDDLYSSDAKFKELVDYSLSKGGSKSGVEFLKSMSNEDKYLAFNRDIVYRNIDLKGNSVIGDQYTKFFNALKEKGYSGIMDTNDIKGVKASREIRGLGKAELQAKGLNTQRPIIFFDISAISNKSISKLADLDFNKANSIEGTYRKLDKVKGIAKEYGVYAAPQLLASAALSPIIFSNTYDSKVTGKTVEELHDIKKQRRSNKK